MSCTRRFLFSLCAIVLVVAGCTDSSDEGSQLPDSVAEVSPPASAGPSSGTAPTTPQAVTSVVDDYSWSVLSSGAGGFVTGASTSLDGSTLVVRTDVGGAYRWDPASSSWTQLIHADRVSDPRLVDWGVESIAVAPNDPSRLVMSVGASTDDRTGRVLRSSDGGRTWTGSDQDFVIDGNAFWRTNGERLAISPVDPDHVWLGTRTEGLWHSTDGGASFSQVSSIPAEGPGDDPAGVLFVVVDPSATTLWAGVAFQGVFRSVDGGASWTLLSPSEGLPYDAELAPDGRLWVAERDPGTIKIIDGDAVEVVNPQSGRRWETVAIDPFDPQHVIVGDEGIADHLYRTTDGGSSWDRMDVSAACPSIPWLDAYSNDFLPTGSMLFDRVEPGKVWIPEGFGVWTSTVDSSSDFAMTCETAGIEELVSNDVVAPPGGAVVTAHWDRSIFWHGGDQATEAKQGPTARFNTAWDLDWSPADPRFLVATVGDQRFCCEGDGEAYHSGFSTDGGQTWQRFSSYDSEHPPDLRFGNIAVSASDTSNLVWLPTFNGPVHASRDQGASWEPIVLPGTADMVDDDGIYRGGSHGQLYLNRRVLAADRIEPSTFYLYHQQLGVFRSTDGGSNWELQPSDGLPVGWTVGFFNASLVSSPLDAGHLLFTPGVLEEGDFPVYQSRDGGATWAPVAGTSRVAAIDFGAPEDPDASAAVYAYGEIEGELGIWRSTDSFESWQLVSSAPLGNYQPAKAIAGDLDEFGTVYVGFTGTSFMVGRL